MATVIGFITDGHLKEKEKSFMKEKRKELLRTFVEKNVKELGINHLVYGGDMFDQVSVETAGEMGKFFFSGIVGEVSRLHDIRQDIIVGNHEKRGKRSAYDVMDKDILSPKIKVRDVIELAEYDDFNAIYVPYMYVSDFATVDKKEAEGKALEKVREMAIEAKQSNGKPVIVFNHNIMGGIWFEAEKEMDVKFYDIPEVDFVLGGHIHKKVVFGDKGLYVGSFMRSFTYEEEDEGFYVLRISDNKSVSGEYVPVKSFDYEKVVVESSKKETYVWKKGHVYSIEFVFEKDNKDNFFVGNVLKSIEKSGGYVKGFSIRKSEDEKRFERVISIANSNEEILKAFLKRDGIPKEEHTRYFEKLEECSIKVAKQNEERIARDKKRAEKTKNVEKKSILGEKIAENAKNAVVEEYAY